MEQSEGDGTSGERREGPYRARSLSRIWVPEGATWSRAKAMELAGSDAKGHTEPVASRGFGSQKEPHEAE
jgi:hypothetical protein